MKVIDKLLKMCGFIRYSKALELSYLSFKQGIKDGDDVCEAFCEPKIKELEEKLKTILTDLEEKIL